MFETSEMELAIGIDLGGTNARVALVDGAGKVAQAVKVKLDDRTPAAVVELLGVQVEALAAGNALPVGVGMAGQILGGSGVVSVAPNLGWRDVPFGALLAKRLGARVSLMNDVGAAAFGEAHAGAARGEPHALVVFVGTGVGSGLILNGRLYTGAMGVAGEFGHVKVVPGGRRCGCGEQGCLEAYVSGKNLTARIAERLDGGAQSALSPGSTAGDLEKAALASDGLAKELWEEASSLLALSLANLVTVLNPRRVILGGGVLLGCPALKEAVKASVFDYALGVSRVNLELLDAQLGDDAGVVGAALQALHVRHPAEGR